MTVTGTPTLTLNDGGTATYTGGSGTNALTFKYTVGATDSPVSALAITQANLPNGATMTDSTGNAVNLSAALVTFSGLQINPVTGPTINSVVESPSTGDLNAGNTVTLTLNMTSAVTVAGGTPTLTLNDGGTATYTGGSGTNALTFSYTVGAGQNTASLAATAVNLNGATIKDGSGNAANLSLTRPDPDRPADRHGDSGGQRDCGDALERLPQRRQNRRLHHHDERSGDGQHGGWKPDIDAQRRRRRDLHRRLRQQCADLQLHGAGWPEHPRPDGVGVQPQRRHDGGRCRQCRQPVAHRHRPGQPADRHHGADRILGGGVRHRHHGWRRRPRGPAMW